jgi:hypothetical protein
MSRVGSVDFTFSEDVVTLNILVGIINQYDAKPA